MVTVTKTDIVAKLNKELNDADNFTFTADEKEYAVDRAIQDSEVYAVLDVPVTLTGVRTYVLDNHVSGVMDIGLDTGDGWDSPFGGHLWRFRTGDNTLVLERGARYVTGAFVVRVMWKYTLSDNIPDFLEEYILQMSLVKTLDILSQTKVNRFLKNDTSMSEMISKLNEARQNVTMLKGKIRHNDAVRL